MARLGVEHRLPEYIPGALPTELPSLGKQLGWPLFFHFEFMKRLHIQQMALLSSCITNRIVERECRRHTSAHAARLESPHMVSGMWC